MLFECDLRENCDIIITAKIISGLVPKARYRRDPMICWKYDLSSGVQVSLLGKGLYPVGKGVRVGLQFSSPNIVQLSSHMLLDQ